MIEDKDGAKWLLNRIQWLTELNNKFRLPTYSNIWQGSYDVWANEQDRLDSINIPKYRTKEAEDAGLIEKGIKRINNYDHIIYVITELGYKFLENVKSK